MKIDARKLSTETQQQLRYTAIELRKRDLTYVEISEILGVHFTVVGRWCRLFKEGGLDNLEINKRGVKLGTNLKLTQEQSKKLKKIIIENTPDKLKLPFYLWTRKAIKSVIFMLWDIYIPLRTVSKYMNKLGFTPQKPLIKAYEQDMKKVERWKQKDYPSIKKKAKKENAEIHWIDETGLRSNANYSRTYAPKGQTPIIKTITKRMHVNIISSVTNQGKLRFMSYTESMTSKMLIKFVRKLKKPIPRKIFMILDNLSVHHSKHFKLWISKNKEYFQVFYLPSYSPELNPDEKLNRDLKMNFGSKHNPKNQKEFRKNATSDLKSIQNKNDRVKKYFQDDDVKYAS